MFAAKRPNVIVFYTDDHGYADLSCQGVLSDIKTPHTDALAASGMRALHGYSTAPQCVPSRGGIVIGKFQSKFGLESNGYPLEGFNKELTLAERLSEQGYLTAQFGKWHLGNTSQITDHGFKHVFAMNKNGSHYANIDMDGMTLRKVHKERREYHIIANSKAAVSLIDRYKRSTLFLLRLPSAYKLLDAPQEYLDRFKGPMPERRRQALAMLFVVDDGVGMITKALEKHNLKKDTIIFYIGVNGAPLKIHKLDAPGGGPGWDGSLNDPLNGEKGMPATAVSRVPYIFSYPAKVPAGQVYEHPVSSLDVVATVLGELNIAVKPEDIDGVNLVPYLSGEKQGAPHEVLMYTSQSSIRKGDWKYFRGGHREYLYNLKEDLGEKKI